MIHLIQVEGYESLELKFQMIDDVKWYHLRFHVTDLCAHHKLTNLTIWTFDVTYTVCDDLLVTILNSTKRPHYSLHHRIIRPCRFTSIFGEASPPWITTLLLLQPSWKPEPVPLLPLAYMLLTCKQFMRALSIFHGAEMDVSCQKWGRVERGRDKATRLSEGPVTRAKAKKPDGGERDIK